MAASRRLPILSFLGYYVLVVGAGALLATYFPLARTAFVSPIMAGGAQSKSDLIRELALPVAPGSPHPMLVATWERSATTALVLIGAIALALPIVWVYMFTRRMRYDRALVQSVIILPLVVAGIVVVVKDSIALAFSLAGIVAAVRFRNTLDDPRDAVYIFLSLGLGLSAGVQALDIALVVTLSFNVLVLVMWRFNLGAIYPGGGDGGFLAMGDTRYHVARSDRGRALHARLMDAARKIDGDGILLVHARDVVGARQGAEAAIARVAKDWKFEDPQTMNDGTTTLPVLIRFKKKGNPVELLGDLDDHWSAQIAAAEFLPVDAEGGAE